MARKKATPEEIQRLNKAREFKRKRNMLKAGAQPDSKGENVCAVCDDGGNLTCCEGRCQRSFHLDAIDRDGYNCREILGLTIEEAKNITEKEDFICKNCQHKQHQCFICGSLGSSDEASSQAEVFQCEHEDCARFYHPECVAHILYPHNPELFELHVAARERFTCPMHECSVCKEVENKNDRRMQFAVCRRCPTAYHRKCLPRDIIFKAKKGPNGSLQRAWENVLPDRILIYCMNHEIVRKLKTPERNHLIFPEANEFRVPKTLQDAPMEQDKDMPEEQESLDHSSEQTHSPPPDASDQNQCSCSGPLDSFAPSSLFTLPYPGSCGWLDD